MERNCHSKWHDPAFDELRSLWVAEKTDKHADVSSGRTLRSHETTQATSQTASESLLVLGTLHAATGSSQVLATCTLQAASGSLQVPASQTPSVKSSSACHSPDPLLLASLEPTQSFEQGSRRGRGRPRGSINKRRRRGAYKSKV